MNKEQIRRKYLEKRDRMTKEQREKAGEKITERVLSFPEIKAAPTIFAYASCRSEVPTGQLIRTLLSEGHKVALPKVTGEEMEFYEISSWEELFPGYCGILEPQVRNGMQPVVPGPRDVMLMPGATFDYSGNRIGYGKGYYDRYVSGLPGKKPLRIGMAFCRQVYPGCLPAEASDEKAEYVITERRKVKTKKGKAKGYGILGDVLELLFEILLELLDGVG